MFCCSPALAATACARMLGEETSEQGGFVNDEMLDVVAEITNMLVGNIKNGLEMVTGPLAISVPTVIHGRNFEFRNVTGVRAIELTFRAEAETFEVRISLVPAAEHASMRSRIPVLGLTHI